MDADQSLETQLRAQIDRIRNDFPETQDLYREVCVLLFFRHGVTPTANKLYQLVRKGSMTAPAEALSKFWDDLRQKSRLRIEHPDLPDELKEAAGALTAALWTKALATAKDEHQAHRAEIQAQIAEARVALEAAESAKRDLLTQLTAASTNIQGLEERLQVAALETVAECSAKEALAAQLDESRQQNKALQASLDRARADFAIELEKQRSAVELAEERYRAIEQRALREIDRERTSAEKLQKELEKARASAIQSEERQRAELLSLQGELGNARQLIGELTGRQHELLRAVESTRAELDSVRDDQSASRDLVSTARAEIVSHQLRIRELEDALSAAHKPVKRRAAKKAATE